MNASGASDGHSARFNVEETTLLPVAAVSIPILLAVVAVPVSVSTALVGPVLVERQDVLDVLSVGAAAGIGLVEDAGFPLITSVFCQPEPQNDIEADFNASSPLAALPWSAGYSPSRFRRTRSKCVVSAASAARPSRARSAATISRCSRR